MNLPAIRPSSLNYPAPEPELDAPASGLNLRKFILCLQEWWWIPLITVAVCLVVATGYSRFAPPLFVSTAQMWETEKMKLPEGDAFVEDQNYLGTQSELLRSARMRQLALERIRSTGTNSVPLDKMGQPVPVLLQVAPVPKSSIFTVKASSENQAFTQLYLDSLMNEYLAYKKNVRKEISGDTLASISDQVLRLRSTLTSDQDALNQFQKTNNLLMLEQEGAIKSAYLAKLKTQLADYQLEYRLLESTALEIESGKLGNTNLGGALFESVRNGGANVNAPAVAVDQNAAYREVELLKLQRDRLGKNLRPKHPKIVKLNEDIERGESLINIYRQQDRDQIAATRQALEIKIAGTKSSIEEWEHKVTETNGRLAEGERLKANVARNQTLYDQLVGLLQNVDLRRNIDQDTLAILEPASPAVRAGTKQSALILMGIVGGMGVGLAFVFFMAVRDDRFTNVMEVASKVDDNIVGQVPEMAAIGGTRSPALLEHHDDRHAYAESYRNLRSALLYSAIEGERPKVLFVTSAVPNEGKSTIATNLARALALGGSRVLLVDGDLRKGRLHDLLHMKREPGLTEAVREQDHIDRFIQTNSLPNFSFLARGSDMVNPSDLFLSSSFATLFARLRERFDYVLIDSSPVFAADDATTLAPMVDGTLFVVRSDFSRAAIVREALNLLTQRQARVLGLILNRTDATARSYHYYTYDEYATAGKPA